MAQLVAEVLSLVRPSYIHAGIELDYVPPAEPLLLRGDREGLRQLVTNLVLNAADAAVAGTHRPPRVCVGLTANDGEGSLSVHDTGPGPDPAVRDRLFESLTTTKPDGAGLGLFVARQIADRHNGRLHWRRDGETTCFCFSNFRWDRRMNDFRTSLVGQVANLPVRPKNRNPAAGWQPAPRHLFFRRFLVLASK